MSKNTRGTTVPSDAGRNLKRDALAYRRRAERAERELERLRELHEESTWSESSLARFASTMMDRALEAEATLEIATQAAGNSQAELTTYREGFQAYMNANRTLEERISILESDKIILSETVRRLTDDLEAAKNALSESVTTLAEVTDESLTFQELLEIEREEFTELRTEVQSLRNDLNVAVSTIAGLRGDNEALTDEATRLTGELTINESTLRLMKADLTDTREENDFLAQDNRITREALSVQRTRSNELEAQLATAQTQLEASRQDAEALLYDLVGDVRTALTPNTASGKTATFLEDAAAEDTHQFGGFFNRIRFFRNS